ncbi:hypothetical protein NDU88_002183 [Pleurodeles waltl]|uniref:Uncharacterized protein n=1 Tax=Pleurodeles waltl TaxID=8319 RepID=A0AAV7P976_PLEWA|nr:hypothetical protein NDU88_002183 [Pleurodeles waltl]
MSLTSTTRKRLCRQFSFQLRKSQQGGCADSAQAAPESQPGSLAAWDHCSSKGRERGRDSGPTEESLCIGNPIKRGHIHDILRGREASRLSDLLVAKPIMAEEVREAIWTLPNGKATSQYGLTRTFCKEFAVLLAPYLHEL